jgi:hypothetical protein
MAAIGGFAVALYLLRVAPPVVGIAVAVIGSIWGMKRGGNGLSFAVIGGVIAAIGVGIFFLVQAFIAQDNSAVTARWMGAAVTARGIGGLAKVFLFLMLDGALTGLAVGISVWGLRYLALLPGRLRLQANRSAPGNSGNAERPAVG